MTILGVGPFEFLILVIIALIVVGPERIPEMMQMAGRGVRRMRSMADEIRRQARSELGDDYDYIQEQVRVLRDLNPRRQVQELASSLLEDANPEATVARGSVSATPPAQAEPAKQEIINLASAMLNDDLLDQELSEDLSEDLSHDRQMS